MYTITMDLKGKHKHVGQGETLEDSIKGLMKSVIDHGTNDEIGDLARCHWEMTMAGIVSNMMRIKSMFEDG